MSTDASITSPKPFPSSFPRKACLRRFPALPVFVQARDKDVNHEPPVLSCEEGYAKIRQFHMLIIISQYTILCLICQLLRFPQGETKFRRQILGRRPSAQKNNDHGNPSVSGARGGSGITAGGSGSTDELAPTSVKSAIPSTMSTQ